MVGLDKNVGDVVRSWVKIVSEDNPKQENVENKKPILSLEQVVSKVASNLTAFFKSNPSEVVDLANGNSPQEQRNSLLSQANKFLEDSVMPAKIFMALNRNLEIIRNNLLPIEKGSFIHGLPIEYLDNASQSVLASEFYTGEKSANRLPFRLFVSEITVDTKDKSLEEVVSGSHTGYYGMERGKVTLVFAKDGDLRRSVPRSTYMVSKPTSEARAMPIGTPSTEISGCIVFNREDEQRVIDSISGFAFPIPVYDAKGVKLYPKNG